MMMNNSVNSYDDSDSDDSEDDGVVGDDHLHRGEKSPKADQEHPSPQHNQSLRHL